MITIFGWRKRCLAAEAENAQLRARMAQMEGQIAALQAQVAQLQAQNARLTQALAAAHKHSGNSSKPPSSDIVKAPKPRRRGKRSLGGQKGHPWNEPLSFPPEQIDDHQDYTLEACPFNAAHHLTAVDGVCHRLQQVEWVERPFVVTEHRAWGYWCEECHQYHYASFPEAVRRAGLFGPRLTSLACYMKGKLHCSYSGLEDFFDAVLGLPVSRSYLAKLVAKGAQAFAAPCQALIDLLPRQPCLNIDETGHKENGQRYWTWCFRAPGFAVFVIRASRGSVVLVEMLGEDFAGVLGADFWSAYRKYARQCGLFVQFCLAHLVREVKYLCEFPQAVVQQYGRELLACLTVLFKILHRRDQLKPATVQKRLAAAQAQIQAAALAPLTQPAAYGPEPLPRLIHNLVRRFEKHGNGYFQFITHPGVEPTNNVAEQTMRFVVQDRHVTQGTRSPRGREISERQWTVVATCALQKRSTFAWMSQAISAFFQDREAPSLLLDTS